MEKAVVLTKENAAKYFKKALKELKKKKICKITPFLSIREEDEQKAREIYGDKYIDTYCFIIKNI